MGFLQIAKSEKCLRLVIKLFVFSICTAGFTYQAWTFLQMYLAYPTAQENSEEYPDEITVPAITICNKNRLSRKLLCEIYPDDCEWDNTTMADEYCETHRRQCNHYPDGWRRDPDYFMSPNYNGKYRTDRGNTILNDVGSQQNDDFIEFCDIGTGIPFRTIQCNITMIQAAKNGHPYKCFTMNSLVGKENQEPLKISLTQEIYFLLAMHPEDYMDDIDLVQAFVAIHDPRKVVNPMTEGVPLKAGKGYKLYVTMERKVSLPPPYASKCVDYLSEWKKNGGYGPLSKKDCIDLCIIKTMMYDYDCVGQEIKYPNNYSICRLAGLDTSPEMLRKCHSICGDACECEI